MECKELFSDGRTTLCHNTSGFFFQNGRIKIMGFPAFQKYSILSPIQKSGLLKNYAGLAVIRGVISG